MVPRTGRRHVQEPDLLGLVEFVFTALVEASRREDGVQVNLETSFTTVRCDREAACRHAHCTETREDDDWELKPLRTVYRHEAHGIFVGLGHRAFGVVEGLLLQPLQPIDGGTQARLTR